MLGDILHSEIFLSSAYEITDKQLYRGVAVIFCIYSLFYSFIYDKPQKQKLLYFKNTWQHNHNLLKHDATNQSTSLMHGAGVLFSALQRVPCKLLAKATADMSDYLSSVCHTLWGLLLSCQYLIFERTTGCAFHGPPRSMVSAKNLFY